MEASHESTSSLSVDGVHSCIIAKWEKVIPGSFVLAIFLLALPSCLIIYPVVWQIVSVSLTLFLSLSSDPSSCS